MSEKDLDQPGIGQVQINAPVQPIVRLTYVFAIAILPEVVLYPCRAAPPTLGDTIRTTKFECIPCGILTER
jgi:hypothetical protein